MEPEQRKTIKSFFLPDPKKTRHEQRQDLDQSPSSPNICSDSSPSIDITFDTTSVTANSGNKSMPVDISRTCNDLPSQPKLGSYPSNSQNRSFRANWYVNRPWLEYSMSNDRVYTASTVDIFVHIKQTLVMPLQVVVITIGLRIVAAMQRISVMIFRMNC